MYLLFWASIKIKKGPGTSFWFKFSTYFFWKYVPYLVSYQSTKFQYHTYFPSQVIKQYEFLNFCVCSQVITSQTLRFIFDYFLEQWLRSGKKRKREIQKFDYLDNEKIFLDEIKSILYNF